MNELENDLSKAIWENGHIDAKMAELLKKDVLKGFDDKIKTFKFITWLCILILLPVDCAMIAMFIFTESTKIMILCAAIFIASNELNVLVKLWYWIVHSRVTVSKEVKRLEFQIGELAIKIHEGKK